MFRALSTILVLAIIVVAFAAPSSIEARPQGVGCDIVLYPVILDDNNSSIWALVYTEEAGIHRIEISGVGAYDVPYDGGWPQSGGFPVAFGILPDVHVYAVTNWTPSGSWCSATITIGSEEAPAINNSTGPANYCYDVSYSLQGDELLVAGHIAGEGNPRGEVNSNRFEEATPLQFPNGDYFAVSYSIDQFVINDTVWIALADGFVCSQAHIGPDGAIHKDW